MGISHFAVNFLLRNKCRDRVDNDNVDRAGTHHCLCDLQSLFTGIRLGYIQIVNVDADIARIDRIQCMFCVNESRDAAAPLHFSDHMQGQCRLT